MSLIGNVMSKEKIITVPYPGEDGFSVDIRYMNREALSKLREKCLKLKWNKLTRKQEEEVDFEKFTEEYARQALIGWKGLTPAILATLIPIDLEKMSKEEIEFSTEDAIALMKNSTPFDQWIGDCMNDIEKFSKAKHEDNVKN